MKKMHIIFTLVVLLAMIPLTYIIGRGRYSSGRSYHGGRHYSGRNYHRDHYRHGYNAAWAIPLAIGTAAAVSSAAASSQDTRYEDPNYYPEEEFSDTEYLVNEEETLPVTK